MAPKAKDKKEDILNVDDAFLKRYVDLQGSRAAIEDIASGEQVDLADLSDVVQKQEETAKKDTDLNAALQRGKQQTQNDKKLHARAKKMDAASEERIAKEKQRELDVQRAEAEREKEEQQAKSIRDVRHITQSINKGLNENINPLLERAGTLPTLGGIGLMLGILAFLLILIVPVNAQGDTRAKQFWYMLNGRAKLQGAVSPSTGSVATFGTPDPTVAPVPTSVPAPTGLSIVPLNGTFRTTPDNLGF